MILELLKIFWTFFKIGLFTIGGGYAMIPMIESEVIAKGWLTEEELVNFLAVSESTPGPFAINIATFIGIKQYGILGMIVSVLGVVLPSIIIIIAIYKIYQKVIKNNYFSSGLNGIKGIVIGLILAVVFNLFKKELFVINDSNITLVWSQIAITAVLATLMIIFKKKLGPILLILIGAGLGIITYGVLPLLIG